MQQFRDTDSNEIITLEQLEREYHYNVDNGFTDPCTFDEYLNNAMTWNGGTLQRI